MVAVRDNSDVMSYILMKRGPHGCNARSFLGLRVLSRAKKGRRNMSYSLNSFQWGYIGDYCRDHYRAYLGGY